MNKPRSGKFLPLFIFSLFLFLHICVGFGKSGNKKFNVFSVNKESVNSSLLSLYTQLNLDVKGLSQQAFNHAIEGFERLRQMGKFTNAGMLTIIDFSKPSSEKRLFVIDIENHELLFNTYVAHGQKSGNVFATRFSNKPESLQSSLGFYETAETYIGKNGYSMKLNGLEKGINDKAEERAIVMHGAPYVSDQIARSEGHVGRSWGCPAVSEKLCKPIINRIKNGTCLFIYAQDQSYLRQSLLL